ncbi:rRNA maturation RNase YbeY [Marinospirillum sp.]|uniref:rRNA maturation RNase YbeY n=1 Tax=Marinospirillum sp. TaxID=2183934 RepID=UPI00286FCA9F|nr:rRNA maturation RNase YbeY [Marinospirillum sp.]MDR9467121.1 rRNA maturation RNase YbeY [Marinospirillum sp.]
MKPLIDLQLATQDAATCPSRQQLQEWVQLALLESTPPECEVTLRLVDEEESRLLNQTYRGKDKPTNVLSFPFDDPIDLAAEGELSLLGDLVICAPLVSREAEQQDKPLQHHWAHLVIHGLLHLQGLDHENTQEAEAMEALETRLLATLGIPDPYTPTHHQQQVD